MCGIVVQRITSDDSAHNIDSLWQCIDLCCHSTRSPVYCTVSDRTHGQSRYSRTLQDRHYDMQHSMGCGYVAYALSQRWTWVGSIHGLGWVAFSSTCDGLGRVELEVL